MRSRLRKASRTPATYSCTRGLARWIDQPRQHPDAVAQQAAIGGVVDRRLHAGAVQAQLACPGDLRPLGQLGSAVGERV